MLSPCDASCCWCWATRSSALFSADSLGRKGYMPQSVGGVLPPPSRACRAPPSCTVSSKMILHGRECFRAPCLPLYEANCGRRGGIRKSTHKLLCRQEGGVPCGIARPLSIFSRKLLDFLFCGLQILVFLDHLPPDLLTLDPMVGEDLVVLLHLGLNLGSVLVMAA